MKRNLNSILKLISLTLMSIFLFDLIMNTQLPAMDETHNDSIASTNGLNCAICFELFKIPKSLPCGHTFCFHCLSSCQTGKKIQCPECRHSSNVPVKGWTTNYAVQRAVEAHKEATKKSKEDQLCMAKETIECDDCKKKESENDLVVCMKCDQKNLCFKCLTLYHRGHDWKSLAEIAEAKQLDWQNKIEDRLKPAIAELKYVIECNKKLLSQSKEKRADCYKSMTCAQLMLDLTSEDSMLIEFEGDLNRVFKYENWSDQAAHSRFDEVIAKCSELIKEQNIKYRSKMRIFQEAVEDMTTIINKAYKKMCDIAQEELCESKIDDLIEHSPTQPNSNDVHDSSFATLASAKSTDSDLLPVPSKSSSNKADFDLPAHVKPNVQKSFTRKDYSRKGGARLFDDIDSTLFANKTKRCSIQLQYSSDDDAEEQSIAPNINAKKRKRPTLLVSRARIHKRSS